MKRNSINKQQGFSLFEVMVVVVILGILATFIVPKLTGRTDQARVTKAFHDIQAIETALDLYKLDNSVYPTTDQGLQALVEEPTSEPVPRDWRPGGYVKRLNLDPWGSPYQYLNPGDHSEIDIFSYGSDAQAGGEGVNAEIGNWQ